MAVRGAGQQIAARGSARVVTFTTTRRSSRSVCLARKTRAKPPCPSSRTSRYGPSSSPGRKGTGGPSSAADAALKEVVGIARAEVEEPGQPLAVLGEAAEVLGRVGAPAGRLGQAELVVDQLDQRVGPIGRQPAGVVLGPGRLAPLPAQGELVEEVFEVLRADVAGARRPIPPPSPICRPGSSGTVKGHEHRCHGLRLPPSGLPRVPRSISALGRGPRTDCVMVGSIQ